MKARKSIVAIAMPLLAGAAAYAYLSIDDISVDIPMEFESRYPSPENAEAAGALLASLSETPIARYASETPSDNAVSRYRSLQAYWDLEYAEKIAFAFDNQDLIESTWTINQSSRDTIDQLHGNGTIIDPTPALAELEANGWHTPYVEIARLYAYRSSLLISKGQSEESIDLLLSLLELNSRLLPTTRNAVNGLACVTVDQIVSKELAAIVRHSEISNRHHLMISAILGSPIDKIDQIERWNLSEQIKNYHSLVEKTGYGGQNYGIPLFLPNDTANEISRAYRRQIDLLRSGNIETAKAETESFAQRLAETPAYRNPIGRKQFVKLDTDFAPILKELDTLELHRQELADSLSGES